MIKLEHVVLASPEQMEFIIEGMRNPMNSWEKSDSTFGETDVENCGECPFNGSKCISEDFSACINIGSNDLNLMQRLANAGTDHRKFMRMMPVYVRITAPLYWWKEFDTYKVGTVANSCSTMHKIQEKEFEWKDFSNEHLTNFGMWNIEFTESDASYAPAKTFGCIISALNGARERYLDLISRGPEYKERAKQSWWQMIQLLPSSYNQTRNVMMNYEVLCNVYKSRKSHRLDEWREFCQWIETLPYHELVCGPDSLREKLNRPSCGVIPNALRESIGMETIPDSEAKKHLELGKAIGEGFRKGLGVKE